MSSMQNERKCIECGAAFMPATHMQVLCSADCRRERRIRLARDREAERNTKVARQTAAAKRKEKARRRAEFFAARDAAFERLGLPPPRIVERNGTRVAFRGYGFGSRTQI